ncbi:hypothetical protein SLEP1_g23046 [Rubroshorea leprosula]|uniref:Uncharacterized protein n=1 Tax=Rubroshorea leprosula TaxID=152421 RepID=A0AAV5JKM1_9ROSI|nr:hypothetical protein SLEP1_g23046 [Rubroshorea leprosula]
MLTSIGSTAAMVTAKWEDCFHVCLPQEMTSKIVGSSSDL